MTWAVFLDRDGVLNDEIGLVSKPEDLRLLPGSAAAVRRLKDAGAVVVVVTNQPVVARGLVTEDGLRAIHRRLEELLAAQGAVLDAIYYCPHHPETHHPEAKDPRYRRDCDCRKPKPGMILEAARRFGADLKTSFLVGDSTRDIEAGRAAGVRSVLVRTGLGGKDRPGDGPADHICGGLSEAADWVLAQAKAKAA